MLADFEHELITTTSMANIEIPIYRVFVDGWELALQCTCWSFGLCGYSGDLIAFGMKKLVLFGTCGILDEEIKETSVIIPTEALRDEGTSYHYQPASREQEVIRLGERFSDGFSGRARYFPTARARSGRQTRIYRETPAKLRQRKAEGAIVLIWMLSCSGLGSFSRDNRLPVLLCSRSLV